MSDLSVPLSGLSAAAQRLHGAARNIAVASRVSAQAEDLPRPVRTEQTPRIGGGTVASLVAAKPALERLPATGPDGAALFRPNVSIAGEFVEMIRAEHAYKASASALRTITETQNSLLSIAL